MPAYIIIELKKERLLEYEMLLRNIVTSFSRYEGRFVVRGGNGEILTENRNKGIVDIIEFPSSKVTKQWLESEEYSKLNLKEVSDKIIIIENDNSKGENNISNEISLILQNQIRKIQVNRYSQIREIYNNSYKLPELQTIKHQICICITFGLDIAAMTLTNHLLEKFLKLALIYNDSLKNKSEMDLDSEFALIELIKKFTSKYDDKVLFETIKLASKNDLINDEEKIQLEKMRVFFRNPYSHAHREKTYRGAKIGVTEIKGTDAILKFLDGKEDELPKSQEKLVDLPFGDFIYSNNFAELDCIPYLIELDIIIRSVESKLYPEGQI